MTPTHRRPALLGAAIAAALAVLLAATPVRAVEPGTTATPAEAAADWLATELEAKDGLLTISFGGPDEFADQGLTIDAVLALLAAGAGDDPAVDLALDALTANLTDYITGFETPADRAANAVAKTLLLEEISGADVSAGIDLDADLRGLMETDGADLGRFTDTDSLGFGQFANGIGQALAILALDRTAGGAPSEAVDYLLDQQCSDGSFRLYQFGYVLEFGPPPVTVTTHSCEDPAEGDADATAFALQALLAVPSSTAVSDAVSGAVAFLLDQQQGSGGFFGTGAVNSNTTGLAAAALRGGRARTRRPTREPPSSRRCRAMPVPSSAPSPMTRAPSTRGSRPTAASGRGPRPRARSASACPRTATSGRWRRCPPASRT